MAAMATTTRAVFIWFRGDSHQSEYNDGTTVRELAQAFAAKLGRQEQLDLMLSGRPMEPDRTVLSYGVGVFSRIVAVLNQGGAQEHWQRYPAIPIGTSSLESFPLPSTAGQEGLGSLEFYVWCTDGQKVYVCPRSHRLERLTGPNDGPECAGCRSSLVSCSDRLHCAACSYDVCLGCAHQEPGHSLDDESYPPSLPPELQKGKIRPLGRCSCGCEVPLFDSNLVREWSDVLAPPDSLAGNCCACDKMVPITISISCGGTKKTQDGSELCQNSDRCSIKALPGIVRNAKTGPVSFDTLERDAVQVEAHPCGDRISIPGLASCLQRCGRDAIVQNLLLPETLGSYAIKCFNPSCASGVYFLPTLRVAGPVIYQKIRDWSDREECLGRGGAECSVCKEIYLPRRDGAPPQCPRCKYLLYPECSQQDSSISDPVAADMRNRIRNALKSVTKRLNSILGSSAAPDLVADHRVQALNLLRTVRTIHSPVFDRIFEVQFDARDRTIEVEWDGTKHTSPTIHLADVRGVGVFPDDLAHPS